MGKSEELQKHLKSLEEIDKLLNEGAGAEVIPQIQSIMEGITATIDPNPEFKLPELKFRNESKNPDPAFVHEGDSGFDLRANISDPVYINSGKVAVVPTGLFFEVEKGMEIQVRSRSGYAANNSVFVLNSPGTVDSRYRGEVKVILCNLGEGFLIVNNGDRVAQGVVCPVYGEGNLKMTKVKNLSETQRNDGGFGSTGVK